MRRGIPRLVNAGSFAKSVPPPSPLVQGLLIAAVLAVVLAGSAGCQLLLPPPPTEIRLEVWSVEPLTELQVHVKQYLDDEDNTVQIFDRYVREPVRLRDDDHYVLGDGTKALLLRFGRGSGDPKAINLDLSDTGFQRNSRFAIHLVGIPETLPEPTPPQTEPPWRVVTATVCYELRGRVYDSQVFLGHLPTAADLDGDTFPEDLNLYTEARRADGLAYNDSCNAVEYQALMDCNPESDDPIECRGERIDVPGPALWNPFVFERCGDCLDEDCYDGDARCEDRDDDGYPGDVDCNDTDPTIHPGASEICGNGIDENCRIDLEGCDDGDLPCDDDEDGSRAQMSDTCGTDCDDTNPLVNPQELEGCFFDDEGQWVCHGCDDDLDNNCDGRINEQCAAQDLDGDGEPYIDEATGLINDCNDCNTAVGPGFSIACGNGVDEDCDGEDELCDPNDADYDGYSSWEVGGSDCDDESPFIYPDAPDYCDDGVAQSCGSDLVCENITDADGDHFGFGEGDCNDSDPAVNPWALEVCDELGIDEDCDGRINEVLAEEIGSNGCAYNPDTELWYSIDYATDINHCGECRHVCCPVHFLCEGETCAGGVCHCAGEGGAACEGTVNDTCCPGSGCVDMTIDVNNCGGCGPAWDFRCVINEPCLPTGDYGLGECFCEPEGSACTKGEWWACCDVGCRDLSTNPEHCGDCENDCTADHRLEGGNGPRGDRCALIGETPACRCGPDGQQCDFSRGEWCTEVTEPPGNTCGCANLNTSETHCGTCDVFCHTNEECIDGACGCEGPGRPDCDGTEEHYCCPRSGCVNRLTDANHCGACDDHCLPGEDCVDGICVCGSCDDGDSCTEGRCVADRCEYHTLDQDDDGFCAAGCYHDNPYAIHDCEENSDCDDTRSNVNPDARENCETDYDDDCDGDTNDRDARNCDTFYFDEDGDTYGTDDSRCYCRARGNYRATRAGDCNDDDREIHTGHIEVCGTTYDDNCNGQTNERDAEGCRTFFRDRDGDRYYPAGAESQCWCSPSGEYRAPPANSGDCDDGNRNAHPGATETCATDFDDDCDGDANDLNADGCTRYYRDNDRDGYYPDGAPFECRCDPRGSFSASTGSDCDDSNPGVNPEMRENCSTAYDDDCDGDTNDLNAVGCTRFYRDNDGDGYYPDGAPSECRCNPRGSFRAREGRDCNDSNDDIHPGAEDICDGVDNDCDGDTDEGCF